MWEQVESRNNDVAYSTSRLTGRNMESAFNPFSTSDVPERHKKSRRPTGDVGERH